MREIQKEGAIFIECYKNKKGIKHGPCLFKCENNPIALIPYVKGKEMGLSFEKKDETTKISWNINRKEIDLNEMLLSTIMILNLLSPSEERKKIKQQLVLLKKKNQKYFKNR